jgi:hypothetical protein
MFLFYAAEIRRSVGVQRKTFEFYRLCQQVDSQPRKVHCVEAFAVVIYGIADAYFCNREGVVIAYVLQCSDYQCQRDKDFNQSFKDAAPFAWLLF